MRYVPLLTAFVMKKQYRCLFLYNQSLQHVISKYDYLTQPALCDVVMMCFDFVDSMNDMGKSQINGLQKMTMSNTAKVTMLQFSTTNIVDLPYVRISRQLCEAYASRHGFEYVFDDAHGFFHSNYGWDGFNNGWFASTATVFHLWA